MTMIFLIGMIKNQKSDIYHGCIFRLAIKSEWLNTTCNHALYALTDVFSQYFAVDVAKPSSISFPFMHIETGMATLHAGQCNMPSIGNQFNQSVGSAKFSFATQSSLRTMFVCTSIWVENWNMIVYRWILRENQNNYIIVAK